MTRFRRGHAVRKGRVLLSESAFVLAVAGFACIAVVGWARLNVAYLLVLLSLAQLGPGLMFGVMANQSTFLVPRFMQPRVWLRPGVVEIYFPRSTHIVSAASVLVFGIGCLSAWVLNPYPFVAPHRFIHAVRWRFHCLDWRLLFATQEPDVDS